jgi:AcrR family transcriptional regulator
MNASAGRRPRVTPEDDGRRRRGADNRARIVAAMLDIVREGEVAPSAEQVAARADVGLRTVFRHFQDMESLYREMSAEIEGELRAVMALPFKAQTWQERVLEIIERRAGVYEKIAPFQRASAVTRPRSRFLQDDHAQLVAISRHILLAQLQPDTASNGPLLEALDLLLSFEAWDRLRVEQGLSVAGAKAALAHAVGKLIN